MNTLTLRQREVLECAMRGMNDRETAAYLCLAVNTVRTHRCAILRRMHARTTTQAAVLYERERADTEARSELLRAIESEVSA